MTQGGSPVRETRSHEHSVNLRGCEMLYPSVYGTFSSRLAACLAEPCDMADSCMLNEHNAALAVARCKGRAAVRELNGPRPMKWVGSIVLVCAACACGPLSWSRSMGSGPTGRARFLVTCRRDIGPCYDRAAHVCHRGYEIVPNPSGMTIPTGSGALFVECK